MRKLTSTEQERLKELTENSISITLIEPTETGLKKSIMDATGPVRNYLKKCGLHDYDLQPQGPAGKIMIDSVFYQNNETVKSKASLYRPNTKKGDPRIWFKGLNNYAEPNDILCLICHDKQIHVLNLTRIPLKKLIESNSANPIKELIIEISRIENAVAEELLFMLRRIAQRGPIPSMVNADTSVGRTLETQLGIDINSSKLPDYKGIELKSFREKRGNRKTLFAQVPDWELSNLKSSAEILNAFGYDRGDDFKLYCTVSAIKRNSQGLMLEVDNNINQLLENSDKPNMKDVVVWRLEKLHQRLLKKHRETFWVSAESIIIENKEHFLYKEVEHTRKPITSQFDILLEQGDITLDHLIKRNSKGKVVEKGPLFKIKPKSLEMLFPPSSTYSLID